jgi:hypothetical protein
VPTSAQAGGQSTQARPATTVDNEIPAIVNPDADLGSKPARPETRWAGPTYFNSQVKAGGHDIGLMVQTINVPQRLGRLVSFAVTDVTTGWYKNYMLGVDPKDYHWSTTGLDIRHPAIRGPGTRSNVGVAHRAVGLPRRHAHLAGTGLEHQGQRKELRRDNRQLEALTRSSVASLPHQQRR